MKTKNRNILYLVLAFALGGVLTSCTDALDEISNNVENVRLGNGQEGNGDPPPPPKP